MISYDIYISIEEIVMINNESVIFMHHHWCDAGEYIPRLRDVSISILSHFEVRLGRNGDPKRESNTGLYDKREGPV